MKAWIGKTLIVIAIGHTVVGLIAFAPALKSLIKAGVINSIVVGQNPDREAAFWFLFTGFTLLAIGGLLDYLERQNLPIPPFVVIMLAILVVTGILVMPISGFWLPIIPLFGLIWPMRRL